jgi:hypothetical protein
MNAVEIDTFLDRQGKPLEANQMHRVWIPNKSIEASDDVIFPHSGLAPTRGYSLSVIEMT